MSLLSTSKSAPENQISIIRIDDSDVGQVVQISKLCFGALDALTTKEITKFIRKAKNIAKVIKIGNKIVGYVFYYTHKKGIKIKEIAIHPHFRRRGYASKVIEQLKKILLISRRSILIADVPERCVALQLCLKKHGFRWVRTKNKNRECESYLMKYSAKR